MARRCSTTLLVLVALAGAGCDLERWVHWLAGDPPPGVADVAQPQSEREPALRTARVREEAVPASPPSARSSFNRIASTPSASARKKAPSGAPLAASRAPREIQPGSRACDNARSNVQRMEEYVAGIEREIERLEEQASDIELHASTRERYEARVDTAEAQLAAAEQNLHDYVLDQLHAGIPQGCLR